METDTEIRYVLERDSIYSSEYVSCNRPHCRFIDKDRFEQLWQFVEDNYDGDSDQLLNQCKDKAGRRYLQADKYVGTITIDENFSLEILPKISKISENKDEENINDQKTVFLSMLKEIYNIDFKQSGYSSLDVLNCPPYEFFTKIFCDNVLGIINSGLASDYSEVEGNESFLKGRLLISKQIQYNLFHKERFYISYETYSTNRPENRLIKSTLLYLHKRSKDLENQQMINTLLPYFENIPESSDVLNDLKLCSHDRSMLRYRTVINWCDLFLHNRNFSTFSGNTPAYAFLFPMETLFERYVARVFKKLFEERYPEYTVETQYDESLFTNNSNHHVRPDILISRSCKDEQICYVIDTKWKLRSAEDNAKRNDIYQMYVYSIKFNSRKTVLLYPSCTERDIDPLPDIDEDHNVNIISDFIDLVPSGEYMELDMDPFIKLIERILS